MTDISICVALLFWWYYIFYCIERKYYYCRLLINIYKNICSSIDRLLWFGSTFYTYINGLITSWMQIRCHNIYIFWNYFSSNGIKCWINHLSNLGLWLNGGFMAIRLFCLHGCTWSFFCHEPDSWCSQRVSTECFWFSKMCSACIFFKYAYIIWLVTWHCVQK